MNLSFDFINPPSIDDLKLKNEQAFKDAFPDLDPTAFLPSTPLGKLIDFETQKDLHHINDILVMSNIALGNVTGIQLDAYMLNHYALKRKPRVHGQVSITIYGRPHAVVPGGFEIRGTDTPPFILSNPVTIPEEGSITVDFVESVFTKNSYLPNTITQIVTASYDVHRVIQPKVSTPGQDAESDLDFFTRGIQWGSLSNNSSFLSILSRVASTPGVVKVNGYENNSKDPYTHQGTSFPPHSVGIVVLGGLDFDIAKAISQTKPPGVVLAGTTEIPIQIGVKEIKYKFFRPTTVQLQASVKVKLSHGYPNNYEAIIKEAVVNYIDALQINKTIEYSAFVCMLNTLRFNFIFTEITIGRKDGAQAGLDTKNLELNFTELAAIDTADITVTKAQ